MRMKIKLKQLNKAIALLVASVFLMTSVCRDALAVAAMPVMGSEQYKQIFSDFILPYNYGKISKSHFAGSDRVVINIQDLHCHPQVQKSISNIIELFDEKYGVSNIYLEGAYGQVSTKWLTERLKGIKKTEVLNKIMDTGKITGAEYYSAMTGKTEIIKGLEEKEPYIDNLKRFGKILGEQEEIKVVLKGIEESTKKIKKQYYMDNQKEIEELSKKYIAGEMRPEKYYKIMMKNVEKLGIDISKYENTMTYMQLLVLQKNLNYKKITTELQTLVMMLKEKLPHNAYKALAEKTKNFEQIDRLYAYLIKISKEFGIDLSLNFKELDKYFKYIEMSQKINPLGLLKEEEKLTKEINTRFSKTVAQREVVFLTHFERYLRDYLSTKISAEDYEYYKENIGVYKELWSRYVDNKVLELLKPYMEEIDKFYKINTERNDYFTNNLFNGVEAGEIEEIKEEKDEVNKIIENMGEVKRIDVVITGGFHSNTVTEILQEKGVSYIVITPNVQEGVKEAEKTYYEIAKQQREISFQTLATLPFSLYGTEAKIALAIETFGIDIASEIFGKEATEIVDAKMARGEYGYVKDKGNIATIKYNNKIVDFARNIEADDPEIGEFKEIVENIAKATNIKMDNLSDEEMMRMESRIVNGVEDGNAKKFIDYILNRGKETREIENVIKKYLGEGVTLNVLSKFFGQAGEQIRYENEDFVYEKDGQKITLKEFSKQNIQKQIDKTQQEENIDTEKQSLKEKIKSVLATAYVWEEIVFRAVPAMAFAFVDPVTAITVFALSQVAFISAHPIANGELNRKDFREWFTDLTPITVVLSVGYLAAGLMNPLLIPAATILGMTFHWIYNWINETDIETKESSLLAKIRSFASVDGKRQARIMQADNEVNKKEYNTEMKDGLKQAEEILKKKQEGKIKAKDIKGIKVDSIRDYIRNNVDHGFYWDLHDRYIKEAIEADESKKDLQKRTRRFNEGISFNGEGSIDIHFLDRYSEGLLDIIIRNGGVVKEEMFASQELKEAELEIKAQRASREKENRDKTIDEIKKELRPSVEASFTTEKMRKFLNLSKGEAYSDVFNEEEPVGSMILKTYLQAGETEVAEAVKEAKTKKENRGKSEAQIRKEVKKEILDKLVRDILSPEAKAEIKKENIKNAEQFKEKFRIDINEVKGDLVVDTFFDDSDNLTDFLMDMYGRADSPTARWSERITDTYKKAERYFDGLQLDKGVEALIALNYLEGKEVEEITLSDMLHTVALVNSVHSILNGADAEALAGYPKDISIEGLVKAIKEGDITHEQILSDITTIMSLIDYGPMNDTVKGKKLFAGFKTIQDLISLKILAEENFTTMGTFDSYKEAYEYTINDSRDGIKFNKNIISNMSEIVDSKLYEDIMAEIDSMQGVGEERERINDSVKRTKELAEKLKELEDENEKLWFRKGKDAELEKKVEGLKEEIKKLSGGIEITDKMVMDEINRVIRELKGELSYDRDDAWERAIAKERTPNVQNKIMRIQEGIYSDNPALMDQVRGYLTMRAFVKENVLNIMGENYFDVIADDFSTKMINDNYKSIEGDYNSDIMYRKIAEQSEAELSDFYTKVDKEIKARFDDFIDLVKEEDIKVWMEVNGRKLNEEEIEKITEKLMKTDLFVDIMKLKNKAGSLFTITLANWRDAGRGNHFAKLRYRDYKEETLQLKEMYDKYFDKKNVEGQEVSKQATINVGGLSGILSNVWNKIKGSFITGQQANIVMQSSQETEITDEELMVACSLMMMEQYEKELYSDARDFREIIEYIQHKEDIENRIKELREQKEGLKEGEDSKQIDTELIDLNHKVSSYEYYKRKINEVKEAGYRYYEYELFEIEGKDNISLGEDYNRKKAIIFAYECNMLPLTSEEYNKLKEEVKNLEEKKAKEISEERFSLISQLLDIEREMREKGDRIDVLRRRDNSFSDYARFADEENRKSLKQEKLSLQDQADRIMIILEKIEPMEIELIEKQKFEEEANSKREIIRASVEKDIRDYIDLFFKDMEVKDRDIEIAVDEIMKRNFFNIAKLKSNEYGKIEVFRDRYYGGVKFSSYEHLMQLEEARNAGRSIQSSDDQYEYGILGIKGIFDKYFGKEIVAPQETSKKATINLEGMSGILSTAWENLKVVFVKSIRGLFIPSRQARIMQTDNEVNMREYNSEMKKGLNQAEEILKKKQEGKIKAKDIKGIKVDSIRDYIRNNVDHDFYWNLHDMYIKDAIEADKSKKNLQERTRRFNEGISFNGEGSIDIHFLNRYAEALSSIIIKNGGVVKEEMFLSQELKEAELEIKAQRASREKENRDKTIDEIKKELRPSVEASFTTEKMRKFLNLSKGEAYSDVFNEEEPVESMVLKTYLQAGETEVVEAVKEAKTKKENRGKSEAQIRKEVKKEILDKLVRDILSPEAKAEIKKENIKNAEQFKEKFKIDINEVEGDLVVDTLFDISDKLTDFFMDMYGIADSPTARWSERITDTYKKAERYFDGLQLDKGVEALIALNYLESKEVEEITLTDMLHTVALVNSAHSMLNGADAEALAGYPKDISIEGLVKAIKEGELSYEQMLRDITKIRELIENSSMKDSDRGKKLLAGFKGIEDLMNLRFLVEEEVEEENKSYVEAYTWVVSWRDGKTVNKDILSDMAEIGEGKLYEDITAEIDLMQGISREERERINNSVKKTKELAEKLKEFEDENERLWLYRDGKDAEIEKRLEELKVEIKELGGMEVTDAMMMDEFKRVIRELKGELSYDRDDAWGAAIAKERTPKVQNKIIRIQEGIYGDNPSLRDQAKGYLMMRAFVTERVSDIIGKEYSFLADKFSAEMIDNIYKSIEGDYYSDVMYRKIAEQSETELSDFYVQVDKKIKEEIEWAIHSIKKYDIKIWMEANGREVNEEEIEKISEELINTDLFIDIMKLKGKDRAVDLETWQRILKDDAKRKNGRIISATYDKYRKDIFELKELFDKYFGKESVTPQKTSKKATINLEGMSRILSNAWNKIKSKFVTNRQARIMQTDNEVNMREYNSEMKKGLNQAEEILKKKQEGKIKAKDIKGIKVDSIRDYIRNNVDHDFYWNLHDMYIKDAIEADKSKKELQERTRKFNDGISFNGAGSVDIHFLNRYAEALSSIIIKNGGVVKEEMFLSQELKEAELEIKTERASREKGNWDRPIEEIREELRPSVEASFTPEKMREFLNLSESEEYSDIFNEEETVESMILKTYLQAGETEVAEAVKEAKTKKENRGKSETQIRKEVKKEILNKLVSDILSPEAKAEIKKENIKNAEQFKEKFKIDINEVEGDLVVDTLFDISDKLTDFFMDMYGIADSPTARWSERMTETYEKAERYFDGLQLDKGVEALIGLNYLESKEVEEITLTDMLHSVALVNSVHSMLNGTDEESLAGYPKDISIEGLVKAIKEGELSYEQMLRDITKIKELIENSSMKDSDRGKKLLAGFKGIEDLMNLRFLVEEEVEEENKSYVEAYTWVVSWRDGKTVKKDIVSDMAEIGEGKLCEDIVAEIDLMQGISREERERINNSVKKTKELAEKLKEFEDENERLWLYRDGKDAEIEKRLEELKSEIKELGGIEVTDAMMMDEFKRIISGLNGKMSYNERHSWSESDAKERNEKVKDKIIRVQEGIYSDNPALRDQVKGYLVMKTFVAESVLNILGENYYSGGVFDEIFAENVDEIYKSIEGDYYSDVMYRKIAEQSEAELSDFYTKVEQEIKDRFKDFMDTVKKYDIKVWLEVNDREANEEEIEKIAEDLLKSGLILDIMKLRYEDNGNLSTITLRSWKDSEDEDSFGALFYRKYTQEIDELRSIYDKYFGKEGTPTEKISKQASINTTGLAGIFSNVWNKIKGLFVTSHKAAIMQVEKVNKAEEVVDTNEIDKLKEKINKLDIVTNEFKGNIIGYIEEVMENKELSEEDRVKKINYIMDYANKVEDIKNRIERGDIKAEEYIKANPILIYDLREIANIEEGIEQIPEEIINRLMDIDRKEISEQKDELEKLAPEERADYVQSKMMIELTPEQKEEIEQLPKEKVMDYALKAKKLDYLQQFDFKSSAVALQMTKDGQYDFYVIGNYGSYEDFKEGKSNYDEGLTSEQDIRNKNGKLCEAIEGLGLKIDGNMIKATMKAAPTEMYRISELADSEDGEYSIEKEFSMYIPDWNEQQTKPEGKEGWFVVRENDGSYYLVNQDIDGLPIGYTQKQAESQTVSKKATINVEGISGILRSAWENIKGFFITEQQASIIQQSSQDAIEKTTDIVNPVELTNMVSEMFNEEVGEGEKIVVVEEKTAALEEWAKKKGVRLVTVNVEQEAANIRGGQLIENGMKYKMNDKGEITIFSKEGITDTQTAKEKWAEEIEKRNAVVAMAENIDARQIEMIENRLRDAELFAEQGAEFTITFDASQLNYKDAKQLVTDIIQETNEGKDAGRAIISEAEVEILGKENVIKLQELGIELLINSNEIEKIEKIISEYGLNGAVLYKEGETITKSEIEKLSKIADSNVKGIDMINTSMYVKGEIEGNMKNEISDKYGVEAIVSMKDAMTMTGRCSVMFEADENINVEDMASKGVVVNIVTNEVEVVRETFAEKMLNKIGRFGNIGEVVRAKSAERRYESGKESIMKKSEGFRWITVENVKEGLGKGEELKRLLTKSQSEYSEADAIKDIQKIIDLGIFGTANTYLQGLLERGMIKEAQGAVRGLAEIAVENEAIEQWKGIGRSIEDIRAEMKKGKYKEIREYMLIRGVQLLMAGENIRELFNSDIDSNLTMLEYLESITESLNKSKRELLRTNRNRIQEIETPEDIRIAIKEFKWLDPLFQEELRRQDIKGGGLSTIALKSVMSAA